MGCNQSDTSHIVVPEFDIKNSALSSSQFIQSFIRKPQIHQNSQINDMPNDDYHLKIITSANNLCSDKKLQDAEKIADKFFELGYIDEAIQIYQKIIQTQPSYKNEIEGLGCFQLGSCFYEWNVFKAYDEKRKKKTIKSSPYDAMSLCYSLLIKKNKYAFDMKKGEIWYRSMAQKYPDNIGIMMGYGNILWCNESYDEAIKMYEKTITLKPDFINAYASIALTYQYKRKNPSKANQYAEKILEIVPKNLYADFILAKNINDVDLRIQKLKEASQKHPEYIRIINDIGIVYGASKKDYLEAIKWYQKCIELSPEFSSPYNNIGVNYEMMEKYEDAKIWYYKAIQIKPYYQQAYQNLRDVYEHYKLSDQQIEQDAFKNEKIKTAIFSHQMNKAFFKQKKIDRAIIWGQKSLKLDSSRFQFLNSLGIAYDEKCQFQKAIELYQKAIQLNPQYSIAYFNCAIAHKNLSKFQQCERLYRKAVEIDPRYSFAWNNLGDIYIDKGQYEQAAEFYQNAVKYNSTYTLALANLGICLLKLQKYKEAFNLFTLAKEALPNDANGLGAAHRNFLNKNLSLFDKEKQKWRKTSSVSDEQKQSLKILIEQFENKFKKLAAAVKTFEAQTETIFQPQILKIIKIIYEDKFQLQKIQEIFELVETLFHQNQEYFHILPLLIIEKFTTCVFEKKRPIQETEQNLKQIMKKISATVNKKQKLKNQGKSAQSVQISLTQSQITNSEVNLFKQTAYFKSDEDLYIQVNRVNFQAKKSFTDFALLVEQVRKKSNGFPGGVSTKIPLKSSEQFKVMLRIMQKMFKKEINEQRTVKLINSINTQLQNVSSPTLDTVVKVIMTTWNNEIKTILKERQLQNIETKFSISDLVRGKCYFKTVEDLMKAIRVVDGHCKTMNYEVIELDNRLKKLQTQDVVFKIRIKDAVCEFQLAMMQDEVLTHLDHCVYEILRSPLGVIFGSYLFMSKQVKYPLMTNCKDIVQKLANTEQQNMKIVKMYADYVLEMLQTVKMDSKIAKERQV